MNSWVEFFFHAVLYVEIPEYKMLAYFILTKLQLKLYLEFQQKFRNLTFCVYKYPFLNLVPWILGNFMFQVDCTTNI